MTDLGPFEQTIDRPLKDIIESMLQLIVAKKVKGQFARDLEKLLAVAYRVEQLDPTQVTSDV